GSAARHPPRKALGLPHRGQQHAWVAGIEREIHRARPLALEEHRLPRHAPVAGAEHPALTIGPPGVAQRGHVHGVGVRRMHADPADVARVPQPEAARGAARPPPPRPPRGGGRRTASEAMRARADREARAGYWACEPKSRDCTQLSTYQGTRNAAHSRGKLWTFT